MKKKTIFFCILFVILFISIKNIKAQERRQEGVLLRDLVLIEGVRTNQLLGYGLVVGLGGTGDSRSPLASQAMQNLLTSLGQKLGTSVDLESRNIAAVLVTAEISSLSKLGARLDATVSSIGDARSLEGGVLIQTPLYAANQNIYAVAQGSLQRQGKKKSKEKFTVSKLGGGVLIEKEVDTSSMAWASGQKKIRMTLRYFDFSTLSRLQEKLKEKFSSLNVKLENTAITMDIPSDKSTIDFIAELESVRVKTNMRSQLVIDQKSGTIVMGGESYVEPVYISQSFSKKKKEASNYLQLEEDKKENKKGYHFSGGSVQNLLDALQERGSDLESIISILETLKKSGSLHTELVIQ